MDRRNFLKSSGMLATGWASAASFGPLLLPVKLSAAEDALPVDNPNLADPALGAKATASSHDPATTFSYLPTRIFGDNLQTNWETDTETLGAWLEIAWPQEKTVAEIWLQVKPLPYDLVYDPYARGGKMQTPRKVTCTTSGGASVSAELFPSADFQIIILPQPIKTKSVRITINDIWPEAGREGTGLGKVRIFSQPHVRSFDLWVYTMYDVHNGVPVQTATISAINPGTEVTGAKLHISQSGKLLMTIPLDTIPARSVPRQNIWIPAPYENREMEFTVSETASSFTASRTLNVPAYHCYFDGGTVDILTTNHNDLGWLNTQKATADYRSAEIILPAMDLIKTYPDFRYSMESVIYLIEFLERHPERREEMAQLMREGKFVWGASYVQNLETHVGPEKLVRQFYLGRRWLHKNFPGCDTLFYSKADPPCMTLQMPQILRSAGIKYAQQGRFPWGFYNWEGPDGSRIFVYAIQYIDPLINPNGNQGWLQFAHEREDYFSSRKLSRQLIIDFNGDYIPPPQTFPPYVHEQNAAMKRFAAAWNGHYHSEPSRQIKPPLLRFVESLGAMEEFFGNNPNLTTLKGDWPTNWAAYDDPGHRTALLAGREGHNRIVTAERVFASVMQRNPAVEYPTKTFDEAWKANCWPDHGWGGNKGTITDRIFLESYQQSRALGGQLLASASTQLARTIPRKSAGAPNLAVYNPLNWQRTDVVRCRVEKPSGWTSFRLRDSDGKEIAYQTAGPGEGGANAEITFISSDVPPVGYRTYHLEPADSPAPAVEPMNGSTMENDSLKTTMGAGGLSSLYDKRLKQEILQTSKFFGGEVFQLTGPGFAWDDVELVTMEDFDKTSQHDFAAVSSLRGPVFSAAVHEGQFKHFHLRQTFRLFSALDRVELDVEIQNWDGTKSRELRVAFPINLEKDFRLSYEVPFGTVEMGKDEIDFSLLPPRVHDLFESRYSGGEWPLPFREAVNWIDASSGGYQKFGCLAAADCTVHLFADQTENPVGYPVLQHMLLSTRRCHAWDPIYYFTQPGNHSYRMALYPHRGGWRARYRDGIAFNFPLLAFMAAGPVAAGKSPSASGAFLRLEPENLIMTALKKSEDDNSFALRFYEAEGQFTHAHIRLGVPIRKAWRTNLIEEELQPIAVNSSGGLDMQVKPWEIVNLRFAV